jgi:hypothetical protein
MDHFLEKYQAEWNHGRGRCVGEGEHGNSSRGRLFSADSEVITMDKKAPDNTAKKQQTEERHKAIDRGLDPFWEKKHEKLNLDVTPQDHGHGPGKGDGNELRKHHDVKCAEDRGSKNLGPDHIHAGQNNHQEQGPKADPLDPAAYFSIQPFKFRFRMCFTHSYDHLKKGSSAIHAQAAVL